MEFITLNNGLKMPAIGFGVYKITDLRECEEAVYQALKNGYRLIDTASAYENEEAVGKAIKRSDIPREEIFVVTKLWITDTNYSGAKKGLEKSLQRLGLDYVDLYIIHQPHNDYYGAWRAMEEMYQTGKVKAIGVDNFTQARLADFIEFNNIRPAVNLVEVNPFYQRQEDLDYLNEKNIQMEAWSPLASGNKNLFTNKTLLQLAQKYNKSVAQIVLRWLYQRGIVPIVKSTNISRMKQNLNIFNFQIENNDMKIIACLDTQKSCFSPRETGKQIEEFLNTAKKYNV